MKTFRTALAAVMVFSLTLSTPVFAQKAMDQSQKMSAGQTAGSHAFKASELIDKNVKSNTGENLGKVQDVVLGPDGRANFFILSGAEDKLIPVPFRALNLSQVSGTDKAKDLTANIDKNKLSNAPSFDKGNWPNLSSSDWQNRIYGYYGFSAPTGDMMQMQDRGTMQQPMGTQGGAQRSPQTGTESR